MSHCFTAKSATVHLVVVVVDGVVETQPPHGVPARRVEEPAMPQSPHYHLLEEQPDISDALRNTGHFFFGLPTDAKERIRSAVFSILNPVLSRPT